MFRLTFENMNATFADNHRMASICKESGFYICLDICNFKFSAPNRLKEHRLTHGEKLLKCKYCPKRFRQNVSRYSHERRHTKLIKCEQWDYRCSVDSELKNHVRKHRKN